MALQRLGGPDAANLVFEHGAQVPTAGLAASLDDARLLDANDPAVGGSGRPRPQP